MIIALADAGLDPQATEHLWTCYEKARAAEDKAGFNTGVQDYWSMTGSCGTVWVLLTRSMYPACGYSLVVEVLSKMEGGHACILAD